MQKQAFARLDGEHDLEALEKDARELIKAGLDSLKDLAEQALDPTTRATAAKALLQYGQAQLQVVRRLKGEAKREADASAPKAKTIWDL